MMGSRHDGQFGKRVDARQDFFRVAGMLLHRQPFVGVELACFVEHAIADPELAHVMQQGAALEPAAPLQRHAHRLGDHVGVQRHPLAVAARVRAFRVDHLAKRGSDIVEVIFVDRHHARGRLQRRHGGADVFRTQHGPEVARLGHPLERRHQLGIEPAAGPLPHFGARRPAAIGRMKYIDYLCHQCDAREHGDRRAGHSVRLALSIEMLVETVDAGRHAFRKTQQARNVGAALAARGDQVLGDLRPVAQYRHHGAEALGQPRFQAGVLEHEFQYLRQAVTHCLEILLERQVVRQIQLADARRIAAAAQVFQQQGVIQIPQVIVAHADLAAHMHADPAAADAMPFRLALGDVERLAEGGDQFGQLDAAGGNRREWTERRN